MTKWEEEEKKGEEETMEEEGLGEEVLRARKDLGGVPEEQRKPGGQRGEILPRRLHAAAACVNVHQQAALTGKSGQERARAHTHTYIHTHVRSNTKPV